MEGWSLQEEGWRLQEEGWSLHSSVNKLASFSVEILAAYNDPERSGGPKILLYFILYLATDTKHD